VSVSECVCVPLTVCSGGGVHQKRSHCGVCVSECGCVSFRNALKSVYL